MNRCEDSYIRTFTGKKFWPLAPKAEDVDILDIAHSLSMTCRWGGHCREFYSVAQHSFLCADMADNVQSARVMLLHDASEAYFTDLPRPVKRGMPEFKKYENQLMEIIATKFGFHWPMSEAEHLIDNRMLATEAAWLFEGRDKFPAEKYAGLRFNPWTPSWAEAAFLTNFKHLFKL